MAKNEMSLQHSDCNLSSQGIPGPPVNISILGIFTTTVLLQWNIECGDTDVSDNSAYFELHVSPITSEWMDDARLLSFIVTRISWTTRQYKLKNLIPETLYTVYITTKNEFGRSNSSEIVTFRTISATVTEFGGIHVRPIEVILVLGILSAWFLTIAWFLRKWGTIRISQPGGRNPQQPKNLDTIKVVDTATDSVIYRNYGQDFHRTMQARQKHLDRMHTMPNIKVNIQPTNVPSPHHIYIPNNKTKTDKYPGVLNLPPVKNTIGVNASKLKSKNKMEICPEEHSPEHLDDLDCDDVLHSTTV